MWTLLLDILVRFWWILCDMAPFLIFGFLFSGILSVFLGKETVVKHLGKGGVGSVLKASLLGIPLPLCSCGVIPVAASLREQGASRGATTAFLVSTPQTGADSILATYGLLGPLFALFRPLSALVSGVLAGVLVNQYAGEDPMPTLSDGCCRTQHGMAISRQGVPDTCHDSCCHQASTPLKRLTKVFHYGFVELPSEIGGALMVGLLLAGLISVILPANFFTERIGTGLPMLLVMMLLGIPIYVCATASVPVAAALIATGATPGAALVFLMTGPATNAATIATISRVLGRKTMIIYLVVMAVCALGFGLFMDIFFQPILPELGMGHHAMLPAWLRMGSALLLMGLLTRVAWIKIGSKAAKVH